jgi:hypothetical protein
MACSDNIPKESNDSEHNLKTINVQPAATDNQQTASSTQTIRTKETKEISQTSLTATADEATAHVLCV